MKLVKFKNGSYGLRKGFFSYKYLDLTFGINQWWPENMCTFNCRGSKERVLAVLGDFEDCGEVVDED